MKYDEKELGQINIEVIDGDRGKNYPHQNELFEEGDCVFLSANNVTSSGFKFDSVVYITSEKDNILRNGKLERNDIVITTRGTVGNVALFDETVTYNDIRINSGMLIVRCKDGVDSRFLYNVLRSYDFQRQIKQIQTGTAQPQLPKSHFLRMRICMPPLSVQKNIASVIDSFDRAIKCNNEINDNLEQQAQALFKSWFLDYEPWDGIVPDSWVDGKLGDFADIKRGGSPRPIQEYLSDTGLRWLKISDVTSLQTPFVIDIKDHIIEEGLKKTVFLKAGSLVLSNSATPGVPKILDVDSCIHDGWLYFPESKFSKEYLYLYFKYIRQQLVNLSNGSVFNNLKTDILKGYPTILPDVETLRRFDDVVKPMFLQMQNFTRESHKLADTRDAILPKLMSGELDVSDIDL